jgi:hypothetical protein
VSGTSPVTIALTAGVAYLVVSAVTRKGRLAQNLAIIRQYRLRHLAAGIGLGAVITAVSAGLFLASPVFEKNPLLWAVAEIFRAGNGNGQANLILSGLDWKWYAVIFLPVLALALPRFAAAEEAKYRAGTRGWADGTYRSLRFGLVHMLMLIPFGVSLALSLAGAWFTWMYFRGGTERSTVYHAAFNTVIVALLFALTLTRF